MKFTNKKISLGTALAFIFISSSIAYSISYVIAMKRFNSIMSYNNEKQQMYSKLSEVDSLIRQDYIGEIDELNLLSGICRGYIEGLEDDSCRFFTKDEYKQYISKKSSEESVTWKMIYDDIGYIKIKNINELSGNMFPNAVKSLQGDGVSKFIIDFRNCNGGEINPAEKILDIILPEGETIYTINKKGEKQELYKTISSGIQVPIVLLVNNETFGIPEMISMAVKGKSNVKIVGNITKGKSFIEREVQFSDGSALIFPTSYYSIGEGSPLVNKGVSPDFEISLESDKYESYLKNELDVESDAQIQRAVSLLNS